MIAIILLTYQRTDYALATIRAAQGLSHPEGFAWYVADDGSREEHHAAVLNELAAHGAQLIGEHNTKRSYGGGANVAWQVCDNYTDITLWLEDDWTLLRPLDLEQYVDLIRNPAENVGMVRFGYLPVGMMATARGYKGEMFWQIDRVHMSYAFSGNPHLKGRKMREAYGEYPVGLTPGDTELGYDAKVHIPPTGPDIVYPVRNGEWGMFGHIGSVPSY